ncbi:MAG: GGDEF domain-containing protein [Bradyrhizobiaceae bacterium]|nr:GGDEF domain-containing protein [Bradyrhizobiaceae bacterium]
MSLDVPTLFIVSIFVTTILGLFLLFAWAQDRSIRALAWWGAAYLLGGLSVGIYTMQDSLSDALSVAIGNALLFVACGVIWNGSRLFHGREVLPFWMFAGAIAWLTALTIPGFAQSTAARIALSSIAISGYTLLTAFELWGGRKERLLSRWPAVAVLTLQGIVFLVPAFVVVLSPRGARFEDFAGGWFGIFALETLLYAIATAFIILTMAKERSERVHRTAATIDPLTEVFNRRALMEAGRRVLGRMAWDRQPVSVLMFDLDHFKKINDRYGHAVGDRALQTFARTAAARLRATDILGRLGGEEFAAILPATSLISASVAAERVRAAFEEAAKEIDGLPIGGTVSIGAAATEDPTIGMDALLEFADKALYAAKASGRNRYVLSGSEEELAASAAADARKAAAAAASQERADRRRGGIASASIAPNDLVLAITAARSAIRPAT